MSSIEFKTWEQVFHNEALVLEEYLSSGEMASLHQSKLRIALDQKFLNWEKYKNWVVLHYQVPYLAEINDEKKIAKLKKSFTELQVKYENHDFLGENLFVVAEWDGHPIVLGIEPNEKLLTLSDPIFILCAPAVMSSIYEVASRDEVETETNSKEVSGDSHGNLGIDMTVTTAKDLNFSNVKVIPPSEEVEEPVQAAPTEKEKITPLSNPPPAKPAAKAEPAKQNQEAPLKPVAKPAPPKQHQEVPEKPTAAASAKKSTDPTVLWNEMTDRHDEYSIIARKHFDAYLVLRINDQKTEVFKMDSDLEKEGLNKSLFSYDLTADNPFATVTRTGKTESFNLSQLGLNILDFKYACITSLKRGSTVVGFLVGFKTTRLSANDEKTLQDLSEKSA